MAGNVILDFPHTQPQLKPEIELKFMDLPENGSVSSLKTYQLLLKRDKRYLLWAGGGISKLVLGFGYPVDAHDHANWRSLVMAYNWQFQYVPLPSAKWIWAKFTRDLISRRRQFEADGTFEYDYTRLIIYRAIEIYWNSRGKNGRVCLLKTICVAATNPIEPTGIFNEIIRLILTPNKDERLAETRDYVNARLAGEYGGDCSRIFAECPQSDEFLDKVSILM